MLSRKILTPKLISRLYSTNSTVINEYAANRALAFPGQGSQFVGMGKDLYDSFASSKEVFQHVDEILGYKLSDLMFSGDYKKLQSTENAQPAIVAVGVATIAALEQVSGYKIRNLVSYTLGHSVGEYTALIASNSLSLPDGIRLVNLRGRSMSESIVGLDTSMVAIITRHNSLDKIVNIVKLTNQFINASVQNNEHQFNDYDLVNVSTINMSSQVTLSGTRKSVDLAIQNLQDNDIAFKAANLPVSAPFHCDLLKPAAESLRTALAQIQFREMQIPVISNHTGAPIASIDQIPDLLVHQTCSTVRWLDSIKFLAQSAHISRWMCPGPSPVISSIIKKEYPRSITRLLSSSKDVYSYLDVLQTQLKSH
ncbi:Malonyl CoA-acyl carrier protein transacylase [Smittium mucronatum]|uniref:[acyl-carrier-protein] S-malonyltransferase n=1 Tax=Smittium mucronatum TaxID=133383 RepID=A0A1R0H0C3_9FUNG|nr:Malonyl CoA-acyl carrier protein transacylase [Smittium mucronatum]